MTGMHKDMTYKVLNPTHFEVGDKVRIPERVPQPSMYVTSSFWASAQEYSYKETEWTIVAIDRVNGVLHLRAPNREGYIDPKELNKPACELLTMIKKGT